MIGPSSHEFPQVFRQEVMKALPGYYVFFDEGCLHVPGPVNGDANEDDIVQTLGECLVAQIPCYQPMKIQMY